MYSREEFTWHRLETKASSSLAYSMLEQSTRMSPTSNIQPTHKTDDKNAVSYDPFKIMQETAKVSNFGELATIFILLPGRNTYCIYPDDNGLSAEYQTKRLLTNKRDQRLPWTQPVHR